MPESYSQQSVAIEWTFCWATGFQRYLRKPGFENIGTTTLRCINVFNKPKYKDLSLNNWMALSPTDLVRRHLNLDDIAMKALSQDQDVVSFFRLCEADGIELKNCPAYIREWITGEHADEEN